MRIVRLKAENFKRIELVDITPVGNVIQITGPNGSGKSSVLDSIMSLVGGKAASPVEPIRAGEKRATIMADLGQYVIRRTFSGDKTTLTVETADGARFGSAQKLLDSFLGSLSFDPLEFARMKPRDQYETIREVAGIGEEIDQIDRRIKEEYEERASWNRQAKEAAAAAAGIVVPEDLPDEPLNVAMLAEQMAQASAHNLRVEQLRTETERSRKRFEELKAAPAIDAVAEIEAARTRTEKQIAAMEERIAKIKEEIADVAKEYRRECERLNAKAELGRRVVNTEMTELRAKIEQQVIPDLVDILAIKEQMANAQYFNSGIMEREKRQELEFKAENAQKMSRTLTASMENLAAEKQRIIQKSKLPIEGIDLVEGEVRYNGVPFAQASDAERLRVSAALAIAMNPKLRVLRVKDGGLLDSSSLKILSDMCRDNDFQVWIEQVDESGKIGVVMSEGRVVADNQKKEEHEDEEQQ